MSENKRKLEQARELFEEEKYLEAGNMVISLFNDNDYSKEAKLLAAKAYLFCLTGPIDENKNQTFHNTAASAADCVNSVDEYLELEYELRSVLQEWVAKTYKTAVDILINKPSLDIWRGFIQLKVKYIEMDIFLQISMRNCARVQELIKEAGIELKELKAKEITNTFSDEQMNDLVFDAACTIFKNTNTYLSQNANSSADYSMQVSRKATEGYMLAELMVNYTIDKKNDDKNIELAKRTIKATIIHKLLSSYIYPNGQQLSLYQGDNRAEKVKELSQLYSEIQELNPDYCPPELPSVEAVKIVNTASSGGCYVASCVYGSYDCPQVWTLRRFRDYDLERRFLGRMFIKIYYTISPRLVKWFGGCDWFKNIFRPVLDRMVKKLNDMGVENTPYRDKC